MICFSILTCLAPLVPLINSIFNKLLSLHNQQYPQVQQRPSQYLHSHNNNRLKRPLHRFLLEVVLYLKRFDIYFSVIWTWKLEWYISGLTMIKISRSYHIILLWFSWYILQAFIDLKTNPFLSVIRITISCYDFMSDCILENWEIWQKSWKSPRFIFGKILEFLISHFYNYILNLIGILVYTV